VDEEAIGADQARYLHAVLAGANLKLSRVWMHYFHLGGQAGALEIDAYLHHALTLPRTQRDLLARAVHDLSPDPPRPCSTDPHTSQGPPGPLEDEPEPAQAQED
jgi:hypothetical protein